MTYVIAFLYVTMMYLKYVMVTLKFDDTPLKVLPIGLLIGSFSIFLVHNISPYNYLNYINGYLTMFNVEGTKFEIVHNWKMSITKFNIIKHYLFTGVTEELCKLAAGYLMFMIYSRMSLKKLYLYIIMSASFFAFIENLNYLETYGPQVLFVRSLFSTTTHISLGMILGYFLVRSLTQETNIKTILYMIFGFTLSVFLHGSFNYSASMRMEELNIIVWIFTIGTGIYLLQRVKKYF